MYIIYIYIYICVCVCVVVPVKVIFIVLLYTYVLSVRMHPGRLTIHSYFLNDKLECDDLVGALNVDSD